VSGSGISWAVCVCTSLQTDNHASTSPLSFLQAGCPSCRPNNSVRALKAHYLNGQLTKIRVSLYWRIANAIAQSSGGSVCVGYCAVCESEFFACMLQSLGFSASLMDSLAHKDSMYLEHRKVIVRSVNLYFITDLPSVLWCCWLGGRKGIQPVKTEWWGAGVVIRLEWGADLHIALVPAHLGSPGQRAVKCVCVCVRACVRASARACVHASVCVRAHLNNTEYFFHMQDTNQQC